MSKKNLIKSIINVFEMGSSDIKYDKIYIYNDGPNGVKQITLSLGFTEYGGNLKRVVELYVSKKGKYSTQLSKYVSKIGKVMLVNDSEFKTLLIRASKEDKLMRDSQDEIYDSVYWNKAYSWFKNNGFKEDLSMLVIFDSFIHSGSILDFLRKRFREPIPINGGSEKRWVEDYVIVRRAWLANHSNKILRNTVYRCDFFLDQIEKNNWVLDCPLRPHGVKVC